MFYLTTHSTHFIYGYMASHIWLRTILIERKETSCCHIGYSFGLTARVLLYASSHRQDNTYHSLCYTSRGAMAGTRNSSMGPPHEGSIRRPIAPWTNALTTELHLAPWRIDPTTHHTMSECSYHRATSRSMKDRSDDPSHHERMLLPQSYISLHHEGSIRRPIAPWTNALTTELHLVPWRIDPTTHRTMSECSYHRATSRSMKDRSDDPSHHERTLLPQSYISLHHEGSIRRPIAPWANALTTELHLAPWRIDPTTHRTMNEHSYHRATSRSTMKDRSDDPSHHERMLLP